MSTHVGHKSNGKCYRKEGTARRGGGILTQRQRFGWWSYRSRKAWSHPEPRRGKERFSPKAFRGSVALPTLWFWSSSLRNCERRNLYSFMHQFCSNLLQQSWATNTGYKEKVGLLDPQTHIFPSQQQPMLPLLVCHPSRDILTEPLSNWQGQSRSFYKWGVWSSERTNLGQGPPS